MFLGVAESSIVNGVLSGQNISIIGEPWNCFSFSALWSISDMSAGVGSAVSGYMTISPKKGVECDAYGCEV